MASITYPVGIVIDDAGAIVVGATVTITSVTDKDNNAIPSHGATLKRVDGSNILTGADILVDYDPESHGEALIVLSVSKVGSTMTGLNAAPRLFAARDSSRILGTLSSNNRAAATLAAVDVSGNLPVADSAGVTTLLARLGVFTGSGVNTVLGFFKALLNKTAALPSDVGGTFDPATDSPEAIRDRGDVAWVTGTVGGGSGSTDLTPVLDAVAAVQDDVTSLREAEDSLAGVVLLGKVAASPSPTAGEFTVTLDSGFSFGGVSDDLIGQRVQFLSGLRNPAIGTITGAVPNSSTSLVLTFTAAFAGAPGTNDRVAIGV